MQRLKLERPKTYDNFVLQKLGKKSPSYAVEVQRTLRRLNEYCTATYKKSRDDVIDYLRSLEGEEREDETIGLVQAFVDYLSENNKITYKVFQVYITHIKKYLKYFKIRVDFRDEIELPPKMLEERYAISLEQIQNIMRASKWKKVGYYLSLISSGARPVEIIALRKKDFTWTGRHWKALIPAKYTKKKISRTVFFSIEATPYLNKILGDLQDEDRVWSKKPSCTDGKQLSHARHNETNLFSKTCDRIGYDDRYETTNFHKLNLYCFRAYFFTNALNSLAQSKDMAHAMIGHGAYLDQYQRRTDEEKELLFEEIEPSLLIFDQTMNKQKIKKLLEANNKLAEQNKKIQEQDDRIQSMEERLYEYVNTLPTLKTK